MAFTVQRAVAGEVNPELRKTVQKMKGFIDAQSEKYKKAGFEVIRSVTISNKTSVRSYYFLKGQAGYSVRSKDGKILFTAKSYSELAKEACIRGIVSRESYKEILEESF